MSKIIHKQSFDANGTGAPQQIHLPPSAKVVGLALQQVYGFGTPATPVVWYERNAADGTDLREWPVWMLQIVGTGMIYEDDMEYLAGPYISGEFVFHLVGKKL